MRKNNDAIIETLIWIGASRSARSCAVRYETAICARPIFAWEMIAWAIFAWTIATFRTDGV